MRLVVRSIASLVVLSLHFGGAQPGLAQQMWLPAPDRDQRFGPNRIGVDVGVLAASVSYARQISPKSEWGLAVSGGAQTGFMLGSSDLTGEDAMPLFAELLSATLFLRGDVAARAEVEGGARVGWFYHASEYETVFGGIYGAVLYRLGALRVGPRVYVGRILEESGRSEFKAAIVPLTLGFRWSW